MNSLEQFEALADKFYKDTGFLAPGKDSRTERPDNLDLIWKAWWKGMERGLTEMMNVK